MNVTFSRNEVIEMAVQIEKRGLEFFEAMTNSAASENVKKVFEFLAQEERNHIATFESLRNSEDRMQLQGPYNWEEVGQYFGTLIDNMVFPKVEEGDQLSQEINDEFTAIHTAISIEKDNILFFREISDLVGERDKKLLAELVDEEKSHIRKLMILKQELDV
jgi:rubrerythrin